MRTFLIGTLVGTFALTLAGYACVTVAGIAADAGGWDAFDVALGPLRLMTFERDGASTATLFGSGIPALALGLGVVNGALALRLRRTHRRAAAIVGRRRGVEA